jgi:hypothetical protein
MPLLYEDKQAIYICGCISLFSFVFVLIIVTSLFWLYQDQL